MQFNSFSVFSVFASVLKIDRGKATARRHLFILGGVESLAPPEKLRSALPA